MRLSRLLAAAPPLSIVAIVALSSCVVPLASADQNCVSYCTLLQGCGVAGAPDGDCNTWCAAFDDTLEHVGCKAAFDDATACVVGDGTCQAASCGDATDTYLACVTQFCSENPEDSACTGS
jgi:hypothetical protein